MSGPRDALPLEPALAFLQSLWELDHALARLSSHMARSIGITAPQRLIIRCVGKYPGMTAGQLARTLHLDPGTVSAALRRLERLDLLERRRDPRDRRRVLLGLTPRGRGLDGLRAGTVEAAVVSVLAASAPADVDRTRGMLQRLSAALRAEADRGEA